MLVLFEGHRYLLPHLEGSGAESLNFIQKVPESEGSTTLRTVENGTTNEEVLAVLIDRMNYLQKKHPCRENAIVITKLEESLMWLNKRTSDRKARSVEGTNAR